MKSISAALLWYGKLERGAGSGEGGGDLAEVYSSGFSSVQIQIFEIFHIFALLLC